MTDGLRRIRSSRTSRRDRPYKARLVTFDEDHALIQTKAGNAIVASSVRGADVVEYTSFVVNRPELLEDFFMRYFSTLFNIFVVLFDARQVVRTNGAVFIAGGDRDDSALHRNEAGLEYIEEMLKKPLAEQHRQGALL